MEATRNNLSEQAIFGYLSTFGAVKEIGQQFSKIVNQCPVDFPEELKQNPKNDYWNVEFVEEESVERCMAKGPLHFLQGVRLHMKKIITQQDIIRQKRQIQQQKEEEAQRIAQQQRLVEQWQQTAAAPNLCMF